MLFNISARNGIRFVMAFVRKEALSMIVSNSDRWKNLIELIKRLSTLELDSRCLNDQSCIQMVNKFQNDLSFHG